MASGWTIDTLKEHTDVRLVLVREQLEAISRERFALINQRFVDAEKSVAFALTAAKEAVTKAEAASEKRFEGVNEFRATLGDQQRTLMPRAEAELRMKSMEDQIAAIQRANVEQFGKSTGSKELWGWIVGVLGVLALVASWLVRAFAKP